MEKEWNERVADLVRNGLDEALAIREASSDESLDPYVIIAPVFSYDDVPEQRRSGIRNGARLGTFPIPANDELGIPACWVDLGRPATVHYRLLPSSARIGALSALAVAHLQIALAAFSTYRNLSHIQEIEDAIGKRIVSVHSVKKTKDRLKIALLIEDGKTLLLEGSEGAAVQAGRERGTR